MERCEILQEYGMEKGRQESLRIMIKNLTNKGMPISDIAQIAECSEEEVKAIIRSDSN